MYCWPAPGSPVCAHVLPSQHYYQGTPAKRPTHLHNKPNGFGKVETIHCHLLAFSIQAITSALYCFRLLVHGEMEPAALSLSVHTLFALVLLWVKLRVFIRAQRLIRMVYLTNILSECTQKNSHAAIMYMHAGPGPGLAIWWPCLLKQNPSSHACILLPYPCTQGTPSQASTQCLHHCLFLSWCQLPSLQHLTLPLHLSSSLT